jgi:hypothetical protein
MFYSGKRRYAPSGTWIATPLDDATHMPGHVSRSCGSAVRTNTTLSLQAHSTPGSMRFFKSDLFERGVDFGRHRPQVRAPEAADCRVDLRYLPSVVFFWRCVLMFIGNVTPFLRVQFHSARQIVSKALLDALVSSHEVRMGQIQIRKTRIAFR